MKRENINYTIVGIVVIASFTLLIYSLTRVSGGVGEHDSYHVFYSNVGGLKEGTPVTYEGFKIGSVFSITPERNGYGTRYRVNITVRDGWSIPVDSEAHIYTEGLLAETVINIKEGESKDNLIIGSQIHGIQNLDLFSSVNTAASNFSQILNDTVKPLLENLNMNLSTLIKHVDNRLPKIMSGTQELVETLQNSADRLPKLLDEKNENKIDNILLNTQLLTENLLNLTMDLKKTQQKADILLSESSGTIRDNREEISRSVQALRESLDIISAHTESILMGVEGTSHNLNEFSRKIRQNPGLLLSSKPPEEFGVNNE